MTKSAEKKAPRKKSFEEREEHAKKAERTRITACVRLLYRIPASLNGVDVAAPSLYPLEVTANNGSLAPPGVCATAIAVAHTPIAVVLPAAGRVGNDTFDAALTNVLSTRYKQYVRCNTEKVPPDYEFQDYQNELYCRLTEVAFHAYGEIALQIVHDGWDAARIFAEMVGSDNEDHCAAVATESLLTRRTRGTAAYKAADKTGEKLSGPAEATIVTGPEPMVVWPERAVLGQERISVTNHGQKRLNLGMTFYLEQKWAEMLWSGVPTATTNSGLFRDECDEETGDLPATADATHLGHDLRNCYTRSAETQRSKFLMFCNDLDGDSGAQYTPTGAWDYLFVCQRPSGHGQTWLNTKLAGMLFLLTHEHPTGGGISLDEIHWHVQRSGAASDTGDFPKATNKPIKFLFVQLLYAIVSHMEPDQTSVNAANYWGEFQAWCRSANANRQKEQLHHIIFYMWRQLRLRGDQYIKLRIKPEGARDIITPHKPYIVDDWASKVTNDHLVAVFTADPPAGCTQLIATCKLHQSLHIICGELFVESIVGELLYSRIRSAVRTACRKATHPSTTVWTLGDVVHEALLHVAIPLNAPVWRLCEGAVRTACGPALLPGFVTHPVYEIVFHEATRITTPVDTLSDFVDVWPAMLEGGPQLKVYHAGATAIVLAQSQPRGGYTEVPGVLVHIKSASCATDAYTCVALSIPEGALIADGQTVDENHLLQVLCNAESHAGCVSLAAKITKREACTLSVDHDVMCNPFMHTPPRPETTTTAKVPLLLSAVCAGGITDWSWRSDPVDWQFTVVLFAPTVSAAGSITYIFYIVFDCSDKLIKIFAAAPVPTEALMGQVKSKDDLAQRRRCVLQYAQTTAFQTASTWVPLCTTKTVDTAPSLPDGGNAPSRWDKIRACDTKHYYGPFVEGETNVTGLLVELLHPNRVSPDALYEGILQWGACYKAVLGLALGRGDESLWAFIAKKEMQLRTVSSKYAVASSGLKRLREVSSELVAARLAECDAMQDLCFFGDGDDQVELTQRRSKSLELKRKTDQAAATIEILLEPPAKKARSH